MLIFFPEISAMAYIVACRSSSKINCSDFHFLSLRQLCGKEKLLLLHAIEKAIIERFQRKKYFSILFSLSLLPYILWDCVFPCMPDYIFYMINKVVLKARSIHNGKSYTKIFYLFPSSRLPFPKFSWRVSVFVHDHLTILRLLLVLVVICVCVWSFSSLQSFVNGNDKRLLLLEKVNALTFYFTSSTLSKKLGVGFFFGESFLWP